MMDSSVSDSKPKQFTVLQLVHGTDMAGAERRSLEQNVALRKLGIRTVAVIAGPGQVEDAYRAHGFKTYIVDMPWMSDFRIGRRHWRRLIGVGKRSATQLEAIANAEQVDIIEVISLVNPHGCLVSKRTKIPLVWRVREYIPGHMWFLSLLPAVFASRIVFVSRAAMGHVPWYARHKGVVIADGIDLAKYSARGASAFREKIGASDDCRLVGLVGAIYPEKGQDLFIETASLVQNLMPQANVKFLIIGATSPHYYEYLSRLKNLVSRLGVEQAVTFVPFQEDVVPALSALDVLVLCSRREGLGAILLEGMACGIPVVSFEVGAIREIVESDANGVVVPLGDTRQMSQAIFNILSDSGLAFRLIQGGYQRVNEFGVRNKALEIAELFDEIIESKARQC